MRGKQVTIPILGMNNQLLDDQSVDGLCESIINAKPKGSVEQPYWAPFEKINPLKNTSLTNFAYEFGIPSITDAFWQVRNFVGEFSDDPNGSLKRLLVLCQNESRKCIDIVEPDTWAVVKTQALPSEGTYTWSCTRLDEVTILSISRDKKPFLLYYLKDDTFIPQGWPDMPDIALTTTIHTIVEPDLSAGNTKGVMREATDQWFMASWAFRLFDGTFVRHQAPILVLVEAGDTDEALIPIFTLEGYSTTDALLVEQPFWKGLIAGISVSCTLPRNNEQEALDDAAFFEVGYWPRMDKLDMVDWPTVDDPNVLTIESKSDNWPTGRKIGIDNYTHHRFSGRAVDTYNKRLLLGGRAVDFALPKVQTNATQNTVPGGVYSDYLTYVSGSHSESINGYNSDGSPQGDISLADYEVRFRDVPTLFNPKTGREFKTVTIVDSNDGDMGTMTPDGTSVPSTSYGATIGSGQLTLSIYVVDSTYTGGNLPGGEWMKIKLEIGPVGSPADETVYMTVRISGPSAPYLYFYDILLESDDVTVGSQIYHRITIKTDSGTYYRIGTGDIADGETEVELPETIWYPDRRAILYELIVENEGTYELALSKQLITHPENNYSYAILTEAEQTYTIGASSLETEEPDLAVNDILQYIPNLVQASISGSPFLFDPAASYRVGNRENDTILGFGVNVTKTNEGQAGQYPVYAFSDKGVWALEQTGDPTIAFGRISPVTNFNGINNPYALTNAGQLIIATDNKYIYALSGLDTQRIDEDIANDPDYADYLKQVRIGYHRATDYEEVIFSNPFYDYSLCYNLKYKVWYKATERFKFFFYDYPELMGMTVDHVLKDFADKDTESPVSWEIHTRVIQYRDPYVFKRMYPFFIRMRVEQPLQENEEDYLPVRIQLKGYRDTPQMVYNLYDISMKSDRVIDPRVYNQFGSMYAFKVILSGTSNHKRGDIKWLDTDVDIRYMETRRRNNCSAQFLYAMESASISICHCAEGSGTDAYFAYTGTAVSVAIITHNLNKIPSVFVTDMDGYLIECGVQLIIAEDQPSLTQIRLTFEDPIPFKAYFN